MSIGGARPSARLIAPALAVALLVGVLSAYAVVRAVGHPPNRCDRFAAAASERRAHDTGPDTESGRRVVVIGDSYSLGLGLERPAQAWPSRLPGRVHVDGFSGSGFSAHASPCGRVSYGARALRATRGGADLVVVEGGLNDADRRDREIVHGFRRLMTALDGLRVLVVGPADAPSRSESVPHLDRVLGELARHHHVPYLRMSALRLTYLDDDLHLTPQGQRRFGDRVARAVRRAVRAA